MIVRLLSPFAGTYSNLDLQKKWWHRLSFVGLILCVLAAFTLTLALRLEPDVEAHRAAVSNASAPAPAKSEHGPWEQYAQITSLPPLPKGYSAVVMLSGQGERIQFPADTTRAELMKALCDHLKQGDAACWEIVSESPAQAAGHSDGGSAPAAPALWRSIARDVGIALAVSLALSYLLQLAYRTAIFVAFGKSDS